MAQRPSSQPGMSVVRAAQRLSAQPLHSGPTALEPTRNFIRRRMLLEASDQQPPQIPKAHLVGLVLLVEHDKDRCKLCAEPCTALSSSRRATRCRSGDRTAGSSSRTPGCPAQTHKVTSLAPRGLLSQTLVLQQPEIYTPKKDKQRNENTSSI